MEEDLDPRSGVRLAADQLFNVFSDVVSRLMEKNEDADREADSRLVEQIVSAHSYYLSTVNGALPAGDTAAIQAAEERMRRLLDALEDDDIDVAEFLGVDRSQVRL